MSPRPTGKLDTAASHILLRPAFRHVCPLVPAQTCDVKRAFPSVQNRVARVRLHFARAERHDFERAEATQMIELEIHKETIQCIC